LNPSVLLVSLLTVCALGCIPMTPTSPGIPAMPSIPNCQKCTSGQVTAAAGSTGVFTPSTDNSGTCAVGSFKCSGGMSWDETDDFNPPSGDSGGPNAMFMATCSDDAQWEYDNGQGDIIIVKYVLCSAN
ncbi:hypothetical protein PENTCL1PPCAC_7723, partial [Pristionchus entomophagus]